MIENAKCRVLRAVYGHFRYRRGVVVDVLVVFIHEVVDVFGVSGWGQYESMIASYCGSVCLLRDVADISRQFGKQEKR